MKKLVDLSYCLEAHDHLVETIGCLGGIRDENLLLSAINDQAWYEDGVDQIIHVAYSICAYHVFFDGNKRTSFLTLKLLDIRLSLICDWDKIANIILELATIGMEKEEFSKRIKKAILRDIKTSM